MFTVELSAIHELGVADIWPDGDAPENPTAEDVANVMRHYGHQRKVMRDWNLDDPSYLTVTVDGVEVWS